MNLLALDTSIRLQSVALADCKGILAQEEHEAAERHSETIFPAVERVLSRAGLLPSDLSAVAVTSGPGTFTGLRVGLATAKGLALAAGVPLAGFSTLRILAEQLSDEARGDGSSGRELTVCTLMEAGRGQLYRGRYLLSAQAPPPWTVRPVGMESLVGAEEALAGLDPPLLVGGHGCPRRLKELEAAAPRDVIIRQGVSPLAPVLARLAMKMLVGGLFPGGPLEPNYIRPPDALQARGERGV